MRHARRDGGESQGIRRRKSKPSKEYNKYIAIACRA